MGFFAAFNTALFALSGGDGSGDSSELHYVYDKANRDVLPMSIELELQDISDLRLEISDKGLHTKNQRSDKNLTTNIYNKMLVFG